MYVSRGRKKVQVQVQIKQNKKGIQITVHAKCMQSERESEKNASVSRKH